MDQHLVSVTDLKLASAQVDELGQLYSWFSNEPEISQWGGPGFEYPMSPEAFAAAVKVSELASFWLTDGDQNVLGFGQFYVRLGRHHLGRLVINPAYRSNGLGKLLVQKLIEQAHQQQQASGESLFVLRHNVAAIKCYQSLGFDFADYPEQIPGNLANCDYMIRPE